MKLCPCTSSDRGARYGAQTGAYLGAKVGAKHGGPFATGFNAGLGAALGYVGGSLLDGAKRRAKPTLVPDGGERDGRPSSARRSDGGRPIDERDAARADTAGPRADTATDDGPTDIPVTEEPLFE